MWPGVGKVLQSLKILSLSFSEPVPLGCELHKYQFSPHLLGRTIVLLRAGLVKKNRCSGVFQNGFFFPSPIRRRRRFFL